MDKELKNKILTFSEDECETFLKNNWGFFGVNKKGITKEPEERNIENLRLECLCQQYYNEATEQ
jgi:hypothetical protein